MAEPGLSCNELVELITDYLEGSLDARERVRFEEHLKTCPGCRTYLDQMRQTVRVVGKLTVDAVPPDMRDELLAAFRGWQRR